MHDRIQTMQRARSHPRLGRVGAGL
jgi:hypothetical protein